MRETTLLNMIGAQDPPSEGQAVVAGNALAATAGIVVVAAAPLLTLHRLDRTDIPATLRVVE